MDVDGGSGVAREFERQRLHVHTCSAMVSSCYFAWAVSGDQPIAPILVSGCFQAGRSGPLASQWAGRFWGVAHWPASGPGGGPLASRWAGRFWGVAHWPASGPRGFGEWPTGQPVGHSSERAGALGSRCAR